MESIKAQSNTDSNENSQDDGEDTASAPPTPPTMKETYDAVDVIRRFALTLQEASDSDDILNMAQKVELILTKEAPKHVKRS